MGIDRADVSSTLLPTPKDRLNLKCTVGGAEHLRNWGEEALLFCKFKVNYIMNNDHFRRSRMETNILLY